MPPEENRPIHQNDRAPDSSFDLTELLYRRYRRGDFVNGKFLKTAFPFPRMSFNRGKYSRPEDVLHPDCSNGVRYTDFGVFEFSVGDVPVSLPVSSDSRIFQFLIQHVPLATCYAHSELSCHLNGQEKDEPPQSVKQVLRAIVSEKCRIRLSAPES